MIMASNFEMTTQHIEKLTGQDHASNIFKFAICGINVEAEVKL